MTIPNCANVGNVLAAAAAAIIHSPPVSRRPFFLATDNGRNIMPMPGNTLLRNVWRSIKSIALGLALDQSVHSTNQSINQSKEPPRSINSFFKYVTFFSNTTFPIHLQI